MIIYLLVVSETLRNDVVPSDSSVSESAREISNGVTIKKPREESEERPFRTVETIRSASLRVESSAVVMQGNSKQELGA